ncbi:glycosyltransferase family 4 protein [Sediminibacterium salmoneum]|uniref:glycosyltransferase family 4 protein n=1 Tax=Sediminibacterium salmoneum TaxID=426421 RepID=UPI000478A7B2|nr:glycosyltransferase family 4 protein [Sediminibacterium salmoneum]
MMSNILFFFSTTNIGGAETNILKLTKEFKNRGHKIYWAFLDNSGPMLQLADSKFTHLHFKSNFLRLPFSILSYYRFIKRNEIECVLNFGIRVEIISRILSKSAGVKRIISNIRSTDDWRNSFHTCIDRLTSKSVDVWISNSLAGKQAFHKREKIPLNKIQVIYNFVELPRRSDLLKSNLKSGVFRLGILANILEKKGYLDLIKISAELERENIPHIIKYAGRDEMNGLFEKLIEFNGLNANFDKLGYIRNKDSFFGDIDIFLLPSYLEGFPTSVLEAISYGKPVVVSNVGGIPEIIKDKKNGFICEPGDIRGFVSSILELRNNEVYESIVRNGFLSLKEFEKDLIIAQWEAHF